MAQFDAAELITQREIVSARIRADLLQRAREFNIMLEDVSIVSWFAICSSYDKKALTLYNITDAHDIW